MSNFCLSITLNIIYCNCIGFDYYFMQFGEICSVASYDLLFNTILVIVYPEVGPRLRHLQLPVVLSMCKALKAQHLPRVIKAGLVRWDGARPRGQMLCPAILLGKEQVPVGRAGVKCQRASICNESGRGEVSCTLWIQTAGIRVLKI